MDIIVKKFGGTSLKDYSTRHLAMKHILYSISKGYKVVVVVSAIGRKGDPYATDTLLNLVGGINTKLNSRELDLLISVGEIISASVFTELLKENGIKATSLNGFDAGIITNSDYQNAKVLDVKTDNMLKELQKNDVIVVTGFQGVSKEGHITTLGRGGSDTSATIIGVALNAKRADIFTDVSGMMTGDPRLVKKAKFLEEVSYEEVANMAHEGAKVIHPRAVEVAQQAHLPLRIRSTWAEVDDMGTLISDRNLTISHYRTVTGVAHQTGLNQFKISTDDCPADEVFKLLAQNNLSVDFININSDYVLFNLDDKQAKSATKLFKINNIKTKVVKSCAKVSIIGAGIMGTPGIMSKMVAALSREKIEILQTTDSYTTIWVLVHEKDLKEAVNTLHDIFLLNE